MAVLRLRRIRATVPSAISQSISLFPDFTAAPPGETPAGVAIVVPANPNWVRINQLFTIEDPSGRVRLVENSNVANVANVAYVSRRLIHITEETPPNGRRTRFTKQTPGANPELVLEYEVNVGGVGPLLFRTIQNIAISVFLFFQSLVFIVAKLFLRPLDSDRPDDGNSPNDVDDISRDDIPSSPSTIDHENPTEKTPGESEDKESID